MPATRPVNFPGSIKYKGNINAQNAFNTTPLFVDGTNFPGQDVTNPGILAAVMFTVAGGVVTIVGQKNVASVTRNAAGYFTLGFTSALPDQYYGVICGCRRENTNSGFPTYYMSPSIDSNGAKDKYSTTELTVVSCFHTGVMTNDPEIGMVIVFNPATVGADYLAAFMATTPPGAIVTLRNQTNIATVARNGAGLYAPTFTAALPSDDYSLFGTSRWQSFAGGPFPSVWGKNKNSTGPFNRKTTALFDLYCGTLLAGGVDDQFKFSGLIRDASNLPRGTLASVRFSYIGGIISIVKSWNVSSVVRISAGLYRITYTLPTLDTNYSVCGSASFAGSAGNEVPVFCVNSDTAAAGLNDYSTTQVCVATCQGAGGKIDAEYTDVWIVKPWLM